MPIYPYSFQLPPLNVQDIPSNGAVGEFLGISAGGVLDWLPVATGGGDMLKSENLSGLTDYAIARTNIGLGTASTPTFANLTLTSPSLTSDAPVTISQTWNGTGSTVFTALKVNATTPGTTSSFSSLLLDLQVGGATKTSVDKLGVISAFSYIGLNNIGSSVIQLGSNSASYGYHMARDYCVTWGGAATLNGSIEVSLCRDGAANTLALRNGINPQTFNVYGSYGSISDYKRLSISCDQTTGNATITNQAAGYTAGTVSINGVPVGLGKGNVSSNVAIGTGALNANVTGANNTIIGKDALLNSTAGTLNVIIGSSASKATLGVNNFTTVVGAQAMENCVTSSYNSAFGQGAGYFISTGGFLTSSQNSVFFGALSRPLGNGETNQIAIGYEAVGIGSNSVVLGNDSITKTALKGNVGIGTTDPGSPLEVYKAAVASDTNGGGMIFSRAIYPVLGTPGDYRGGSIYSRFISVISEECLVFAVKGVNLTGNPYSNFAYAQMVLSETGKVGIGTTSPRSKLHVAGNASPSITVDNTLATGASQLLFKNTVVTGDTDGIFLNGSTQTGFGGAGSLNIKATTGPLAFHTASVTNALSIAQSGAATFNNLITSTSLNTTSYVDIGSANIIRLFCSGSNILRVSNQAGDSFSRVQLGGVSNSYPAIKRNGANIDVVLADDSGFTFIKGKLTTETAFTATTVTPNGFITLYDTTGTAYRVPCVAAP